MSLLFSACRRGVSTRLCSSRCLTLIFSPDFAIFPILSDSHLLIYFLGHLGLARGLKRNHMTWWLAAQMQESEKTWDWAVNSKLFVLCRNAVKWPLPITQHRPWNTLISVTIPDLLLLVLWPWQLTHFSGPIYLYWRGNTMYLHR